MAAVPDEAMTQLHVSIFVNAVPQVLDCVEGLQSHRCRQAFVPVYGAATRCRKWAVLSTRLIFRTLYEG